MAPRLDRPKSVLVVTGPARERLAGLFRRVYAGRDDVVVVVDRRVGERRAGDRRRGPRLVTADRRRASRPAASARRRGERRRGERRRAAPWLVFPPNAAAA